MATVPSQFSLAQLKKILVTASYVDEETFDAIAEEAAFPSETLNLLLFRQVVTKDLWGQALAEHYGLAYADLNSRPPQISVIKEIPQEVAEELRIVIFDENETSVVLATDQPQVVEASMSMLKENSGGKEISLAYSLSEDIDTALLMYRPSLQDRVNKLIGDDANVPEILEEIFHEAGATKSSDIHFEPQDDDSKVVVRVRIDGVLQEVASFTRGVYDNILNRIKILANLRIDEHTTLQDGSLQFAAKDTSFDVRVSVAPMVTGEKVVMRILSSYVTSLSLEKLGASIEGVEVLRKVANKPFGMVVVAGPTGSGKTTTSYTLLQGIENPTVNITTIEDPVEYRLPNINQIQVSSVDNITFAKGLRSIVRQDPDVILVGEIRDVETANIAVNAALTGHLLFSTFHANTAAATIPRLLQMEIEPFLLASTLQVVVGQRLVRVLCSECRYSTEMTAAKVKKIDPDAAAWFAKEKVTLYEAKGCDACSGSGYRGRIAVMEILEVTESVRALILQHASAANIEATARKEGMATMFENGLEKVLQGVTSLEELLRVVEVPNKKQL